MIVESAAQTRTLLDVLRACEKLFCERGIESPRLNSEILLAHTLNTERINLYLNFEQPLTEQELSLFRNYVKRRLNREPMQYILGYTEFYGLKLKVNPSVLIPRRETELLVEKTIEACNYVNKINPSVLEIGTGSGCISISAAKNIDCKIDAIDISETVLELANENAAANNVTGKINFQCKDFLNEFNSFTGYDIVVSNPPYIPKTNIDTLQPEVKDFEPISALTDNADGNTFYKKIIECVKNTKNHVKIILELGDGRSESIQELFRMNGNTDFKIIKDLNRIDRIIYFEMN